MEFLAVEQAFARFQQEKSTESLEQLQKQLEDFYRSLDKETHLYNRRVAIVIYDALRKNTLPTISSEKGLEAVQKALELLYRWENEREGIKVASDILDEAGLDWIMGEKFTG